MKMILKNHKIKDNLIKYSQIIKWKMIKKIENLVKNKIMIIKLKSNLKKIIINLYILEIINTIFHNFLKLILNNLHYKIIWFKNYK